jgi:hypothetical protein
MSFPPAHSVGDLSAANQTGKSWFVASQSYVWQAAYNRDPCCPLAAGAATSHSVLQMAIVLWRRGSA